MKEWKWDGKYPVRCKIVDAAGIEVLPGMVAATPDASKPHIEKQGTAELLKTGVVRIKLDDGSTIYGHQCWWDALPPKDCAP